MRFIAGLAVFAASACTTPQSTKSAAADAAAPICDTFHTVINMRVQRESVDGRVTQERIDLGADDRIDSVINHRYNDDGTVELVVDGKAVGRMTKTPDRWEIQLTQPPRHEVSTLKDGKPIKVEIDLANDVGAGTDGKWDVVRLLNYDGDRLVAEEVHDGEGRLTGTVTYTYDDQGRRLKAEHIQGDQPLMVFDYSYENGRCLETVR